MGKKKRMLRHPKKYGKKYGSHPIYYKGSEEPKEVIATPAPEKPEAKEQPTSTKTTPKKSSKKRTYKKASPKK